MKMAKEKKHNDLSKAAQRLGRAGGLKGGVARDAALSHEEKQKIAAMGGKASAAKRKAVKSKLKGRKKGDSK
jgi:hypothetical protein